MQHNSEAGQGNGLYSQQEDRGGKRAGARSLRRNQREKRGWGMTTQVAVNFYFNPLSENFKIRFGDKTSVLGAIALQQYNYKKLPPLSLSLPVSLHGSFAYSRCLRKTPHHIITPTAGVKSVAARWAPLSSTGNCNWITTMCEMKA